MEIKNVRDLMRILREGKYTSIGSYPIFFVTGDGDALSYDAVRAELWRIARATQEYAKHGEKSPPEIEQWAIVFAEVNWEDKDLICAHTGKPIECAYPGALEDYYNNGGSR